MLLSGALVVGERVELVDEPLCVDPTQRVQTDRELAGVIADNHGVAEKVMRLNAAPQRPFRGDLHRVGFTVELGDAKPLEMRLPGAGDRQIVCQGVLPGGR